MYVRVFEYQLLKCAYNKYFYQNIASVRIIHC